MKEKLRQWGEYLLALLLSFIWKKAQKKMEEAIEDNKKIGKVPVETLVPLTHVFPLIIDGLKQGLLPHEIEQNIKKVVAKEALHVAEGVINIFAPGIGTLLGLIVWLYEHSKSYSEMTQEEVNRWMDTQGAGPT